MGSVITLNAFGGSISTIFDHEVLEIVVELPGSSAESSIANVLAVVIAESRVIVNFGATEGGRENWR